MFNLNYYEDWYKYNFDKKYKKLDKDLHSKVSNEKKKLWEEFKLSRKEYMKKTHFTVIIIKGKKTNTHKGKIKYYVISDI